jgi:hypothetical protein
MSGTPLRSSHDLHDYYEPNYENSASYQPQSPPPRKHRQKRRIIAIIAVGLVAVLVVIVVYFTVIRKHSSSSASSSSSSSSSGSSGKLVVGFLARIGILLIYPDREGRVNCNHSKRHSVHLQQLLRRLLQVRTCHFLSAILTKMQG